MNILLPRLGIGTQLQVSNPAHGNWPPKMQPPAS